MSKSPIPTEQDLLDLVEGVLPAERIEVMRTVLRADPALARRLQAMVEDRKQIRRMSLDAERTAPAGQVAAAVTGAERDELLTGTARSKQEAPAARYRRVAAMIALCLLLGGVLTGAAWFLSRDDRRLDDRLAAAEARRPAGPPRGVFAVPDFEDPPRPLASLPDLPGITRQRVSGSPSTAATVPARGEEELPALKSSPATSEDVSALVGRWNQEVAENLRRESNEDGAASDAAQSSEALVGGMPLSQAAALAIEGRLQITGVTRDVASPRAQVRASLGGGTGRVIESTSPNSFTVELTARYDPNLDALQDVIAGFAERIAGDSFSAQRAELRLSAAPEGAPGVGAALPSFRADDVLWWTRPMTTWERMISVRASVEIVPASK